MDRYKMKRLVDRFNIISVINSDRWKDRYNRDG